MNIKIGNKEIGENKPVYFIADIAANHDGSMDRAKKLIKLAKDSGADAAKFQNFKAETIVHKTAFDTMKKQAHQSSWSKSVYEVYSDASVPQNWTLELKKYCDSIGIEYFSTPYDFESADYLNEYVKAYKIGSGDINWIEYLDHIAKKDLPVIISTGACDIIDIELAVNTIKKRNNKIAILQCNTNYTADKTNFEHINLNVLKTYRLMYPEAVIGLSDHTRGYATVLGAVSLGAKIIEKHFTDDNNRVGPDHHFAMNPIDFGEMVLRTRELEAAFGSSNKKVENNELESYIVQRRCLYYSGDLNNGDIVTRDDIQVLRPALPNAVKPEDLGKIIGRKLAQNVKKGECIKWNQF